MVLSTSGPIELSACKIIDLEKGHVLLQPYACESKNSSTEIYSTKLLHRNANFFSTAREQKRGSKPPCTENFSSLCF